jgi:hypothetical protein
MRPPSALGFHYERVPGVIQIGQKHRLRACPDSLPVSAMHEKQVGDGEAGLADTVQGCHDHVAGALANGGARRVDGVQDGFGWPAGGAGGRHGHDAADDAGAAYRGPLE